MGDSAASEGAGKFTNIGLGVMLIEHSIFADERGTFVETYDEESFKRRGIRDRFVEFDVSVSRSGVLRGLHFQREPFMQGKLVRCVAGDIFDVAVDIRRGSPTFGKYVSVRLSSSEEKSVFIPRGFAHGFEVLGSADAKVLYHMDNRYSVEHQDGMIWNDPDVNIQWPLKPKIISKKDMALRRLRDLK